MNGSEAASLVITPKSSKLAIMKRLLPLMFLLVTGAALAESGAYRVEIIVFRNLLTVVESTEVPGLRSFSQFPDLADTRPGAAVPANQAAATDTPLPVELSTVLRAELPDDLRVVTQKSDVMDGAWRRLRSSNSYRPLIYTAWEQNRIDYYPPIRIHDPQVITTRLQAPTAIMLADLTAPDPLAAYRSNFYQLDGSLQLRRSRFLHLFLDLEWREERPPGPVHTADFGGEQLRDTRPVTYGVFVLQQNHQINTGEMQYFDTPYLGALVYVTSVPAN